MLDYFTLHYYALYTLYYYSLILLESVLGFPLLGFTRVPPAESTRGHTGRPGWFGLVLFYAGGIPGAILERLFRGGCLLTCSRSQTETEP